MKPPSIAQNQTSFPAAEEATSSGRLPSAAARHNSKPVEEHVTSKANKQPSLTLKQSTVPWKQPQQPVTIGKTSKAKDKFSPIRFGRLRNFHQFLDFGDPPSR